MVSLSIALSSAREGNALDSSSANIPFKAAGPFERRHRAHGACTLCDAITESVQLCSHGQWLDLWWTSPLAKDIAVIKLFPFDSLEPAYEPTHRCRGILILWACSPAVICCPARKIHPPLKSVYRYIVDDAGHFLLLPADPAQSRCWLFSSVWQPCAARLCPSQHP